MFCVNTLCDDTKQGTGNGAASGAHPLSLSNSVRNMANHWFLYTDVNQSADDRGKLIGHSRVIIIRRQNVPCLDPLILT